MSSTLDWEQRPSTPRPPTFDGGSAADMSLRHGSTILETFLAGVRNFATYFCWSEEDELLCLLASLWGPVGQLLWDLGSQVMLVDLIRLLCKHFGTSDQAK